MRRGAVRSRLVQSAGAFKQSGEAKGFGGRRPGDCRARGDRDSGD